MSLPVTEGDAALCQVVWRKLHEYAVARHNSDIIGSHLARNVTQDFDAILKLDVEQGVRQRVEYSAVHSDNVVAGAPGANGRCGDRTFGLRFLWVEGFLLHAVSVFLYVN